MYMKSVMSKSRAIITKHCKLQARCCKLLTKTRTLISIIIEAISNEWEHGAVTVYLEMFFRIDLSKHQF